MSKEVCSEEGSTCWSNLQDQQKKANQFKKERKGLAKNIPIRGRQLKTLQLNQTTQTSHLNKQQKLVKSGEFQKDFIMCLSKVQISQGIKLRTLQLAFGLYEKSKRRVSVQVGLSMEYKIACIYIAAKFEEIYPPLLRNFQKVFKKNLDQRYYIKIQQQIVRIVELNLNIMTPFKLLNSYYSGKNKNQQFHIHYLLELSAADITITKWYTQNEVAAAVKFLMEGAPRRKSFLIQREFLVTRMNLENCSKMILNARNNAPEHYRFLHLKYSSQRYGFIACESLPGLA